MQVTVESYDPAGAAVDLLALPLFQIGPGKHRLAHRPAGIDRALGGRISAALATQDFQGKRGESLLLYPGPGVAPKRILLVGLGPEAQADAEALRRVAGAAVGAAATRRGGSVALVAPALRRLRPPALAQALSEGAILAGYRYDTYHTRNENGRGDVSSVALLFDGAVAARAARAGRDIGVVLGESQNVARDLSNAPANALPPSALAREAERVAKEVGLASQVLDVAELKRRKLGAILAVGQGSENPPRMIVLEHRPPGSARRVRGSGSKKAAARRRLPKICLVGKGITFDSGGISIKPGEGMHEMKHDMSGGAAVIGALRAAALLKLPLHLVGIVAAAENMPSGAAYRPGDVVTAGSGKTIEVLNTDAEGRLVLADALHLARTEHAPDALIDLATLTGACVVALGKWCSGLFGNSERLLDRLRSAGEATAERAWRLPLWEEHREHIRGNVADIKNTGGREGGALTAAAFLWNFVGDTPWAHIDIAGTAYTEKAGPYQPRGATGVGVRLLLECLREWRSGPLA
jgi:leucyl aminopeptidase